MVMAIKNLYRLLLAAFGLAPLLTIVYLSLVTAWSYPRLWDVRWGLEHWEGLASTGLALHRNLLTSLLLAMSMSLAGAAFGYRISKALLFEKERIGWLQLSLYPYLMAPVVLGSMLQYYFLKWGLMGSFWGVLLAQALFILPFSVLLMASFWTERVRMMAWQAVTLGAGARQLDRQLLLPLARPWLALTMVQCFVVSWFEYGITQVIGLGKVETLTIKTMHFVKEANPHLAALAGCLLLGPLLLLGVLSWVYRRRLGGGG